MRGSTSLAAALLEKIGSSTSAARTLKDHAKDLLRVGGKLGLKSGVRLVTAGIVRASELSEANAEVAEEIGDELEAEWDRYIEKRLTSAKKERLSFNAFREKVEEISCPPKGKKTIFVVDDLDRCQPEHALSIIEVSKHLFSVKNVYFVLMSQMDYLASCVNGRYGESIDSGLFLEKFIQARITFPIMEQEDNERALKYFMMQFIENFPDDEEDGQFVSGMLDFLSRTAARKGYTLRRVERILTQFGLCVVFSRANEFRLSALIYVLCDMKIAHPDLFRKAKNGTLTWAEIKGAYVFDDNKDEWISRWLRYFHGIGGDISDDERRQLKDSLWKYSLPDDHRQVARYLANNVVDRIGR
ncbi:MAG: hypothetical protein H6892_02930 [Brucellaceae bacterium]|nr:hypothetical protein [Brucellaceae bacterium]